MIEDDVPKRRIVMRGAMEAPGCRLWVPLMPPAGDCKQRENPESIDSGGAQLPDAESDHSAASVK